METKEGKDKRKCWISCTIILILFTILLIVQLFFVPNILTNFLHSEITNRLVMTPDKQTSGKYGEYFDIWQSQRSEGAGIGRFKYWVFNITNPVEVANNTELPIVDTIGPYVYTRYEEKTNIVWSDDETTVSYVNTYDFEFEPDLSTDVPLTEKIYCVSGQMIVFLRNPLVWLFPDTPNALETWPAEYIFAYDTIETFLHGYVDKRLEELTGLSNPVYFVNNDTIEIEEYTGYPDNNLDKIRELIRYRGNEYQQWGDTAEPWNTTYGIWNEWVNNSRESGRQWRPENTISKDDVLEIFSPEKFRKVKYSYVKEVDRNGLTLHRYRINDDEWWTSTLHPESTNFRYGQNGPYDGIMRLDWTRNTQSFDSFQRLPIMLSKGLYLDAPEYQQNISIPYGMPMPDPENDDQYIDIEPISGTAFRIMNTYMLTLQVNPLIFPETVPPFASNFSNLPQGLWIPQQYVSAEAFAQDSTVDFFVERLNLVNALKYVSWIGLPVIAVILFFIAVCIYYRKIKNPALLDYGLMETATPEKPYGSAGVDADLSGYGSTNKETTKV